MAEAKPKSDLVLIREYFECSLKDVKEFVTTPEGKAAAKQLGEGIRNGSLTY